MKKYIFGKQVLYILSYLVQRLRHVVQDWIFTRVSSDTFLLILWLVMITVQYCIYFLENQSWNILEFAIRWRNWVNQRPLWVWVVTPWQKWTESLSTWWTRWKRLARPALWTEVKLQWREQLQHLQKASQL